MTRPRRTGVPPSGGREPPGSGPGAKRLISDAGEMVSAHLSCFAYSDLPAGLALLTAARSRAAAYGFPAVFVAVPGTDADPFAGAVVAPAVVYGAAVEPGADWVVNTAEV